MNRIEWLLNGNAPIRTRRDEDGTLRVEYSKIDLADLRDAPSSKRTDSHRLLCGAGLLRVTSEGYALTQAGRDARAQIGRKFT